MEKITSRSNDKIKFAARLREEVRERRESGLFIIEGVRLCCDAARSSVEIDTLFVTADAMMRYEKSIGLLERAAKQSYEITTDVASRISDTKQDQGVFCICKMLDKISDIDKIDTMGKYVALENISDPSNLGAAARTAEALGMSGIIVASGCDIYNPKAQRASMGSLLRLPVFFTAELPLTLGQLREKGMLTLASVPDSGARPVTEMNFSGGAVCVIGNEGAGITEVTASVCDIEVTIPMKGRTESLNASAAAAILMWEMMK
ncbi:MAG: RNA methyltransferase [Clostridiales bacterium]|nr:RNA methyltransferase [Clostridiales bacterium]